MILTYEKLVPEARDLKPPADGDIGIDLYSAKYAAIPPNQFEIISTGLKMRLPDGYGALVRNRSREEFLIGAGVIDPSYRGELHVKVFNLGRGNETIHIFPGDSVGQLVLIPAYNVYVMEGEVEQDTDRGVKAGIIGDGRT